MFANASSLLDHDLLAVELNVVGNLPSASLLDCHIVGNQQVGLRGRIASTYDDGCLISRFLFC